MNGICTLANDLVYDQLIALLNSIEAIYGHTMPVCIYPYDDRVEKIAEAIRARPQVQLYQDRASIERWDQFVRQIWDLHPTARQRWGNSDPAYYHRVGTHRRFCAFDGPFERFLYMDADTLLLDSVDSIFAALGRHDWVVYDFQYKDPTHVYEMGTAKLDQIFGLERVQTEIFCSGFYASKRYLFDQAAREQLLQALRNGDAEILYPMAPDQTILNYMVMKSAISSLNLALSLPASQRTGNSVTSPHFIERDHRLYDRGKRLTYLHYIGISSQWFARLCAGENIDFPYRDLFLHYRYLKEPRPSFSTLPKPYNARPSLMQRVIKKVGLGR
ncbi:MAG: Npun_R2821/Npun_R2822 family protein [Leptolyngbya sp. IPPAS B-1204]|uniref:Sugar transferase n=1 Tax=Leptolyngbya sp. NK1-12 TaxID=2547451 RepID=A0AA96WB20_9CYAN|nr:sugar transferase [Elainella sp. C42_A2020_010]RNJ70937.1 MAG: sugar transferase [Leptolyngbya sp. IPPAS B-1204]WNZ21863.1 sugar transferase [Leptolyngbya sp. NK1-12]